MISVWPLESESNVIHEDLFFNFINQLYSGEGILKAGDLAISVDTNGIGVKIAPGAAIVSYDSAFGGKRVFYNSVENRSGANRHPNDSFTVNTSRWTAVGAATITRDTGMYNSAPASGKIATSGASSFDQGMKTPDAAGTGYRVNSSELQEVSCWINAAVGTTVRLKITEYDAGGAAGATHQKDISGTGGWVKNTVDPFTTAATCKFLKTEVLVSAPGSVNVFCDDFTCRSDFDWIQGFEISDPTNPRVDRVVVQIRDSAIAGGGDTAQDGKFRVISGTPTAGATLSNLNGAVAVPSNCFLLANVLVPANATALVVGNLDQTVMVTATLNVVIPPSPGLPTGSVIPFAGSSAPSGYVFCDGATYNGTLATYADLWSAIGTTYGGTGISSFKVPDTQGRMPVGRGTHADINALGENEGEATVGNRRPKHKHTVSISSSGTHNHGASGSAGSAGGHSHGYTAPSGSGSALGGPDQPVVAGSGGASTSSDGAHGHSISVDVDDGGSHGHAGSTVGPTTLVPTDAPGYIVFNMIIKL